MLLPMMAQAQTLEECQQAAIQNFPLIKQYDLIEKTTDLTVSNIQKGWLPQVSAYAQATYQSDVMSWPEQMKTMMNQMGIALEGLKKDQYKVGVDINQMVYDGGMVKNQKEIARQKGQVNRAQNEVNLYAVRKRVNEMYFALLLLEDQIKLNQDMQELLQANEKKLASMFKSGVAAESDYSNVKAERLKVVQQLSTLQSQKSGVLLMLSALCGMEIKEVQKPVLADYSLNDVNNRPELRLVDSQIRLADAQEKMLKSQLMPKLSVFASGYYGYPGYNMFEDMMSRRFSWNGMVGARMTWNIGALYTHKNDKLKIKLQHDLAENSRETFLFNNRLEQIQQNEQIERYRKMVAEDEEIINLRRTVRKAAESKLAHGIIDVHGLIREISNENNALLQQSIHEIEMLKGIYDMKYTTNN